MNLDSQKPNPFDYLEIQNQLDEISSEDPFEILFYGSRERGDYEYGSDFNFYLLASTQDQMRPGFIQRITSSMQVLEKIAPVNLVAGDRETFRIRLNLCEPSVIHMLEKGTVFYGDHIFHNYQKDWQTLSKREIPKEKLIPFLNRRVSFYRSLSPRNEKDNAVRQERVYSLSIQVWALKKIPDISLTELIHLDIPSYYETMIPVLYKKEIDQDVLQLLEGRRAWSLKKRFFQRSQTVKVHKPSEHIVLQSTHSI